MKIAFIITTSGNDLNVPLDGRFGWGPKSFVYDVDTNAFELIDNQQNHNAVQGLGSNRRKRWRDWERVVL